MTERHKQHLKKIVRQSGKITINKYTRGVSQHGGYLEDLTPIELLDEALAEAIDQMVYLLTLREKMTGETIEDIKTR